MVRLVVYLLSILLIATGLGWLADRPGTLQIAWQGYDIETSVFRAAVLLAAAIAAAIFFWSLLRAIWNSPAALGDRIVKRRQKRGLEALSSGMIAVGAGDKLLATRYAVQARKALPHEPLTHLLRAQAAQLSGDRTTTRRIYEAMLASPETEQLGLRGLYLEAEREGATEAATQFADRALKVNPKLGWSSDALFDMQCKQKDWAGALVTLAQAKRHGHVEKARMDRKRAVLLAAQAQDAEESDPEKALALAMEAHALAPELVPASAVAGRIHASRGNTGKAAKVLQKTWARAPHPDIASAYAYARIGDSTRDRLDRMLQLAALNPQSIESPIAVATTAVEARAFGEARKALEPLLANRLTQRVAILMARIEAGETGDKGKVREWLARAAHASRDPVWYADGIVSARWEPVSPKDGRLDAFEWRVPVEAHDKSGADVIANRIEELLALGGPKADTPGERLHDAGARVAEDVIDADAITVATGRTGANAAGHGAPHTSPDRLAVAAARAETATSPAEDASKAADAVAKPATPLKPTVRAMPNGPNGKPDAKIFVAPHAPDDPGTDVSDQEGETKPAKRPFRAIN